MIMATIVITMHQQEQSAANALHFSCLSSVCVRVVAVFLCEIENLLAKYPESAINLQVIVWSLEALNDICPKSWDADQCIKIDFSVTHSDLPSENSDSCNEQFYSYIRKTARQVSRRCLSGYKDIGLNCNLQIRLPNNHGFATGFVFNRAHRRGIHVCTGCFLCQTNTNCWDFIFGGCDE